MAIVDSLSSPDTGTDFDANADCHIILVWTNENNTQITTNLRYANAGSKVFVQTQATNPDKLRLRYNDGSAHTVAEVEGVFTSDIEYRVDIYANGTNVKIDVDDVEKINETVTYNATQTGGNITHDLASNDIELESWPYGEPAAGVEVVQSPLGTLEITGYDPVVAAPINVDQVPLGTLEITGYDPVVSVAVGDWEIGAYIYTAIGGVDVNVGLGTLAITGLDPVVTIPVDVAATLGTLEITGYDPVVTVPVGVTAGLGTLEVAGFSPTVSASLDVTPSLGLLSVTGYNPSVTAFGGTGSVGIERIAIRTVHMAH